MKNHWRAALWCLPACPLAAWANNVPTGDGVLGLVLLFPAAMLGMRLAGARLPQVSRARKIVAGIFLAVVAVLTVVGTVIGALAALFLLFYGVRRTVQMSKYGQPNRRFAAGVGMALFSMFAIANYFVSYASPQTVLMVESSCTAALRTIGTAEETFKAAAVLDANKNKIGEYGTLKQLEEQGLLERGYLTSGRRRGYRFVLELSEDPAVNEKQYFLCAMPTDYGDPGIRISLLGALRGWRGERPYAHRTFASDETGVIRARDLGGSRPITRAEAEKWPPL